MTSALEPACVTVTELLSRSYIEHADRLAVEDSRESFTYAELARRAQLIAGRLRMEGLQPGDRVLLLLDNRSEFVQVEHAIAVGHYVRVAVNTRMHAAEVTHVVQDAAPAYAFIESGWLARAGADWVAQMPCPVVEVGGTDPGMTPSAPHLPNFPDFLTGPHGDLEFPPAAPEEPVWFMYTSGSTGMPKGVVHTHRTMSAMARMIRDALPSLNHTDAAVHTAPLSHMSGAVALAVTAAGGNNVMLHQFEPKSLFDLVDEKSATVIPVVPTQLNMLTGYLRDTPRDLSSIRLVPYAGSAIAPDRLEAAKTYFGDALVQMYGASETPMPLTSLPPQEHVGHVNELGLPRFASAGRPVAGVEIQIRDLDNTVLPAGERGEIVVRSPTVSPGYWNQPAATAEILEPDGFCHTGDVGVMDDEGYLFLVDRKKDMIISGGFNVYPREVENALSDMPGVAEVAVVSAPSQQWGESIVAVIAPEPGIELTLEQVQDHCRATLAGYKVPRQLALVDALPKGGTGKVLKRELAKRYWGDAERRVGG
jgi:acyl-CoA synthetase (AMP-forming)/AMP-acid ligase II